MGSNNTLKPAATSGGSVIALTGSSTGEFLCFRFASIPAGGGGLDFASLTSYPANARNAFRYAEAAGGTMPGTIRADMDTIFGNQGVSFNSSNPKNAMATAF